MRLAPEQMTSAALPVSIKTSLKLHFLTEKPKKFNFMQVICRTVNTYNFTPETGFGSAFFSSSLTWSLLFYLMEALSTERIFS